jgi:hypothetical protein
MHVSIFFNLCVAILTSGYALLTTQYSPIIYGLCLVSIIFMSLEIFLTNKTRGITEFKSIALVLIFITISSATSTLFNYSAINAVSFFKFILVIYFSFFFCLLYDKKKAVDAFLNFFLFLSTISLLIYLIVNLYNVDLYFMKIENVNGVVYNVGLFYVYLDGFLQFRNVGVFWEPGIYASFLMLALCLELYFYNNTRKKRVLILLITLLTTFSSAAVILFCFYILLTIAKNGVQFSIRKIFIIALGASVLSLICYYLYLSADNLGVNPFRVFEKLLNPEDTEGDRFTSPFNSLEVFSLSPFFGWGLSEGLTQYLSISTISLTATSFYYLAVFGIFGLVYSLLLFLAILMLKGMNFLSKILIIIVTFIILNKEPHIYFTISYIFLFYLLMVPSRRIVNEKK